MTITKVKVKNAIIKEMGNLTKAAQRLGCVRKTVYNWIEKEPELAIVVEEARDTALDFVENKLMDGIREGHPTLIIFFLKTQGRKRGYIERQEIEYSGTLAISAEDIIKAIQDAKKETGEK